MGYRVSHGNLPLRLRPFAKALCLFHAQVLGLLGRWITSGGFPVPPHLASALAEKIVNRRLAAALNRGHTALSPSWSPPVASLLMSADGDPAAAHGAASGLATPGAQRQAMERFLAEVEKRAYQHALLALRHPDDALDAVQDAMLQLCRRYAERPASEWRPLFFRILVNKVRDLRRRRAVRGRWLAWWTEGRSTEDEPERDVIDNTPDPRQEPLRQLDAANALQRVGAAVQALPARQQQAFLLRNVEGMNTADTALAMGCTEGSVKTHYFRALQALRAAVGEELP